MKGAVNAAPARSCTPIAGLYAVTPECAETGVLETKVEQALRGGARVIQYRAKGATPALALEQARALARLCRAFGRVFIVNDQVDLALAVGADGVHLGAQDEAVEAARRRLPPGMLLGVSCYDRLDRAREAVAQGADYVAFGAVFPSPVKPEAVRAPLALLGEARRALDVPLVAIGGITPQNASEVIRAGAHALAVISALFDAPDVEGAARAFSRLFDQPSP
ncbi:thiamine phosphate synthase [Pelomicrobium sp. G1]|uniref:thiamine phosphate synthase n=1 Tax=unclassified Pelomicrobium TaxID=2815318 RepID=UPI000B11335C|nr:MAG: thiamine-phosphate synthase [Burkholderiales bacterium]